MHTPENIAAVAESVCEAPSTSIHRRSQEFNISETSLKRILHKDLGMTPYKVQLAQQLKPIDHPMQYHFAKWACDRLTEDADFGKKKSSFQMNFEITAGRAVNLHDRSNFQAHYRLCLAVYHQWLYEYCPLKRQLSLACRRNTYF